MHSVTAIAHAHAQWRVPGISYAVFNFRNVFAAEMRNPAMHCRGKVAFEGLRRGQRTYHGLSTHHAWTPFCDLSSSSLQVLGYPCYSPPPAVLARSYGAKVTQPGDKLPGSITRRGRLRAC